MPRPSPPAVCAEVHCTAKPTNVALGSHDQYVPTLTAAAAWHVNAAVSKAAWWPWPFDPDSGVRVTCDVHYLCANFGLPRPLLGPMYATVVRRQTDRRQTEASLNAPAYFHNCKPLLRQTRTPKMMRICVWVVEQSRTDVGT